MGLAVGALEHDEYYMVEDSGQTWEEVSKYRKRGSKHLFFNGSKNAPRDFDDIVVDRKLDADRVFQSVNGAYIFIAAPA